MKRRFVRVATSLVAVGLLELVGLTSSAAAYTSVVPAAKGARLPAEWYFAYGARYDEKAMKALPPESFDTRPSNPPLLAWTVDAPGIPANRSEGAQPQIGWLLPAPQSCSQAVDGQ
jgi:hypothetical protein